MGTLAEILTTPFDYAFELGDNDRGRTLGMASRATIRCTNSYERPEGEPLSSFWKNRFNRLVTTGHGPVHQVLRDYNAAKEVLSLPEEVPPLRFVRKAWLAYPLEPMITGPYAVIHAATRWSSKSWSLDRWRKVTASLLEKFPQVIISCGPNAREMDEAENLCIGHAGRVFSTGGRLSWAQLAQLLGSASLFVGVDTAAMHLAAAVQCPSVVLFGHAPSYQFRPWKSPHRIARSRDALPEKERMLLSGEQLMGEISAEEVIQSVDSLLESGQIS
jgi:heptosyltransferase-3